MEIFARKVLLSAVESENLHLTSELTQRGAQSQGYHSQNPCWAKHLSSAVSRGHGAMVELLCKAGVPPKTNDGW